MRSKFVALGLAASVAVSACAKNANEISAQYISPMQYESYSCRQLSEEAQRVSSQAARLTGVQNEKASSDAVATGVALVLFWPAAFFIDGNGETASELGRLKGELEAIEKVSIKKNCGIQFQHAPAPAAREPEAKKPSTFSPKSDD
ncbi:hypothetical protein [Pseudothioclava arenosa]|uniref:Lipoprotein n=1 Tax=Pseudothioclava arenosa TaxID=1795308 RepID=A0A2A4CPQ9_9RHOB|nr:hypothetical protein [Pseudothioclava arenosa]PCD76232.1 hypothetical protein CLN94_10430 [Pseudothioclava arenosa]